MSRGEPDPAEARIRQRAKLALRQKLRAVRAALPSDACDARSAEITRRLLDLEELRSARTVLAFASIRNEVRTGRLIEALWERGDCVLLPRVAGDELDLRIVGPDTPLEEGAFSVPEPPIGAASGSASEVDFALVPALAVDPHGYRIGYGGGYYDRLLPCLTRATSCVVAYDFQLIAEVPALPFDVPVDLVVTDRRVIRTK